jgi:hypothetical protein
LPVNRISILFQSGATNVAPKNIGEQSGENNPSAHHLETIEELRKENASLKNKLLALECKFFS